MRILQIASGAIQETHPSVSQLVNARQQSASQGKSTADYDQRGSALPRHAN